jgi:hypothetical protein
MRVLLFAASVLKLALLSSAVTCTALAQGPGPASSGSISGIVVGEDGRPLAATVSAVRVGGTPAGGGGVTAGGGHAEAGADGAFNIPNLSDATYRLCARVKSSGYLDPCSWEPTSTSLQLTAGHGVTGHRLVVKKGATLQVRVNDLSQLLEAPAPAGRIPPHVLLEVFTEGHLFEPLALLAKDARGRTHQGTIPLDRASSLYIRGHGVQLTDAAGYAIGSSGGTLRIKPGKGNQPIVITFNVH